MTYLGYAPNGAYPDGRAEARPNRRVADWSHGALGSDN